MRNPCTDMYSLVLLLCFLHNNVYNHSMIIVPTVSPSFVVTSNQSAIVVTWELLTLIEARGFIEYLVHLHKESSAERQSI